MVDVHTIVILTVVVALAFDLINGFHDAANSIATIVSTRLLSPGKAVIWAASFNFLALFIFHQGVAKTVSSLVKVNASDPAFVYVVLAGLIGAIAWNLLTWWLGLPSSSSHAIMGGFSGAGLAYGGLEILNLPKLALAAQFIVISHNKRTMESADNLYGVTMQEAGVSKLVSVNLAKLGKAQAAA